MNFAVGSFVRFVARFKSVDGPRDPREVVATITIDGVARRYSMSNGGIQRRGEGVYTVDVLIDSTGELTVRFDGDAGFGETTYDVGMGAPIAGERDVAPSSRPAPSKQVEDEVDEFESAAQAERDEIRRLDRLAALEDAGIDADGRSDSFIDAAYDELQKKREPSPGEAHAAAMRNAWRRAP